MVSEEVERSHLKPCTLSPVDDQDELRRRIRAARILRNMSQAEMNQEGHKRGLPKHTLGGVERGDLAVQHVHLAMVCEILDVPMAWFSETDAADTLNGGDQLDRIERLLLQVRDMLTPPAEAGQGHRRRPG